jgi:serine/threonine protein phosphatase PrpC
MGARDYQEDAYAVWADQDSGELHLVLADGMGGAENGAAIAEAAVEAARRALAESSLGKYLESTKTGPDPVLAARRALAEGNRGKYRESTKTGPDPVLAEMAETAAFDRVVDAIGEVSEGVLARHGENGGATLIACRAWANRLWFASVGDSALFLRRDGRLFELNRRHEYRLDLWRRVLNGALTLAQAEADPQADALASYIGCEHLTVDRTAGPIALAPGDTLLACSDGVTDTLPLEDLRALLALEPQLAADALGRRVPAAAQEGQDNYTAVVARHYPAVAAGMEPRTGEET